MMQNLKIRQTHKNLATKPFGVRGMSPDVIDTIIIQEEIRIMKRRVLCTGCFEYKSTSGACSC